MTNTVSITQEEFAFVAELGRLRTEENKARWNIPDYDTKRFNLTSLQANRLGVLTEFGIGKWLGLDMMDVDVDVWAGFVKSEDYAKYLGQPDIAGLVEVRRANKEASPLPLRRKDVKAGAFVVQGFVKYRQQEWGGAISVNKEVSILGWSDAKEDWDTGDVPSWSLGDSRVVSRRSPESFPKEEIMSRLEVAR